MNILSVMFLIGIFNAEASPIACIEDDQCTVGFFCHEITNLCHECLSCEEFRRQPALKAYDCIKSDDQCGPCLKGLVNSLFHWGSICFHPPSPESKSIVNSFYEYIFILTACLGAGVFLSIFIIHVIWKTHIIKINIAIPTCKNTRVEKQSPFGLDDVAART